MRLQQRKKQAAAAKKAGCREVQMYRKDLKMDIVLASSSPRRRELLHQIGWEFRICVSQVEEKITKKIPWEVVEELSRQKAEEVFNRQSAAQPLLVIGADTIVACDGRILGKPGDRADAIAMLKMLQNRSHHVYTGVTLYYRDGGGTVSSRTFHEETLVSFYPMTEEEILSYVDSGEPMDKAGAYGIQGLCARYISGIQGDYNNVVGLPVGRLYQEVRALTGGMEGRGAV